MNKTKMPNYNLIAKKLEQFKSPMRLGLAAFVIIILLITWSGIKAVQTNYRLEKQISALQQQNAVQNLKDQNQKLQNDYYNSDQYLELSARQNFGLAAPGEKVLIVPKAVAMSYVKKLPGDQTNQSKKPSNQSFVIRNLEAWYDFFRGQHTSSD